MENAAQDAEPTGGRPVLPLGRMPRAKKTSVPDAGPLAESVGSGEGPALSEADSPAVVPPPVQEETATPAVDIAHTKDPVPDEDKPVASQASVAPEAETPSVVSPVSEETMSAQPLPHEDKTPARKHNFGRRGEDIVAPVSDVDPLSDMSEPEAPSVVAAAAEESALAQPLPPEEKAPVRKRDFGRRGGNPGIEDSLSGADLTVAPPEAETSAVVSPESKEPTPAQPLPQDDKAPARKRDFVRRGGDGAVPLPDENLKSEDPVPGVDLPAAPVTDAPPVVAAAAAEPAPAQPLPQAGKDGDKTSKSPLKSDEVLGKIAETLPKETFSDTGTPDIAAQNAGAKNPSTGKAAPAKPAINTAGASSEKTTQPAADASSNSGETKREPPPVFTDPLEGDVHKTFDRYLDELRGQSDRQLEALAEEAQRLKEEEQRKAAQAGNGQGGGGAMNAIASIVGLPFKAVSSAFGAFSAKKLTDEDRTLSERIRQANGYRAMTLEKQYREFAENARQMYVMRRDIAQKVDAFNRKFAASAEGKDFLVRMDDAAKTLKKSRAEIWQDIHSASPSDPKIAALKAQASALAHSDAFGRDITGMEIDSRRLSHVEEDLKRGMEKLSMNGVDTSEVTSRFSEILDTGPKAADSLLADPGGEKLDEMRRKMAEMVRNMIDNIRKLFGLGGGPSGP